MISIKVLKIVSILVILLIISNTTGCSLFSPVKIVKHPDTPMQILEIRRGKIKVAVYDSVSNKMIEFGWIEIDDRYKGWTLTKYDWEKFIKKKLSTTP